MSRIVVITGASSGIGAELKKLYLEKCDTVLTISRSEDKGNECHYACDVSNEEGITKIFKDIGKKYQHIDILINNAGFGMSGVTELIEIDKIKNLFDVNFYGLLYCTRAALPYMSEGSKIVNMSSAMALFPVPFRAYYGAVKSAVLSLTYSWRMELKAVLGIDMFAICPGNIKTNFTKNRVKDYKTDDRYKDVIEKTTAAADKDEDKRIPVEKAAKECFKIIEKKKHRPMYIIGGKFKLLYFVSNRLPKSCLIDSTANLMIKK